jgi:hypothetical protein
MKRSFLPPARDALLVFALSCGAACTPNQGVKPGPPELIEFTILQAGGVATTVKPDTPDCVSGIASGAACLPMGSDAGDGGVALPPDSLCRDATAQNWCTCVADADDGTMGVWSCEPFANVMAVIAVFDRLLDTAPFEVGDAGLIDVVTADATPATDLLTDYSATGARDGFIFNLFGPAFFGNFRGNGPSLFAAPQPEFPSGATVTISLDAQKVRAKDGTTPFTGDGLLQAGQLVFTMAPFAASVTAPADAAMDPAVTVAFTNFADPTGHISATANGTAVAVDIESGDGGATFTVKPTAGAWPAGATIVVTVDATAPNLIGQMVAAAASTTFTAP